MATIWLTRVPTWIDLQRSSLTCSNNGDSVTNFVSIGCGTLFINCLRFQLGFSLNQIVQAGGDTLAETYRRPTNRTDAFERFSDILARRFPPGQASGLTNDNPFPLNTVADSNSPRAGKP
jgi:hypothetical protein